MWIFWIGHTNSPVSGRAEKSPRQIAVGINGMGTACKLVTVRAPQWSLFIILVNTLLYSLHDPLDIVEYKPKVLCPTAEQTRIRFETKHLRIPAPHAPACFQFEPNLPR